MSAPTMPVDPAGLTTEQIAAMGCPHAAAALAAQGASEVAVDAAAPTLKPLPVDALESALAVAHGDGGGHTGILLVNHGSRSPVWRKMLLDVQADIADELLAIDGVAQVRTGFMEYTEPSIASQLRAFDEAGIERVLVIPLLLTVSDHSLDDIPTICGQSADPELLVELASENIEVYQPTARVEFAPLLDFSGLVRKNLARRLRAPMASGSGSTALVLIGYGSAEFDDEWNAFFEATRAGAHEDFDIAESTHAWCGHLVDYKKGPTLDAVNDLLTRHDRVVVVPQLVSYDPMFQERIIGRAVRECDDPARVLYTNDSILPEPAVARWVVRIATEMLAPVAV